MPTAVCFLPTRARHQVGPKSAAPANRTLQISIRRRGDGRRVRQAGQHPALYAAIPTSAEDPRRSHLQGIPSASANCRTWLETSQIHFRTTKTAKQNSVGSNDCRVRVVNSTIPPTGRQRPPARNARALRPRKARHSTLDADILEPSIPKHEIPDRIWCQPRTRGLENETGNAGSRSTEEPSCHPQKRKLDVDVSPPPYGVGKRARASAVDAKGAKGMLSENVNKASTPMQPFCTGRTAGLVEPAVPPQQPPRDMVPSSNSIKAPALSGDMVNFTPPFLLGPSLYYLFSPPRQPLSKTLGRLKISLHFQPNICSIIFALFQHSLPSLSAHA